MLLCVSDRHLPADAGEWVMAALMEGVTARAPGVAFIRSSDETGVRGSSGSVLALTDDEPTERLRAAAAGAACVVRLTAGAGAGVRAWLGLDSGRGWRVPVAALIVTDQPLADRAGLRERTGAQLVRRIPTVPDRRTLRGLRRVGRWASSAASAPRRFDSADRQTRRGAAVIQAEEKLKNLLAEPGVEEFQIRGGESMTVQLAGGLMETRESPFRSERELIEAVRFLATFNAGERPQRFDPMNPRLDIRVGDHWRLHAEGFVVQPAHLVLRSNMAGRMSLADLGLAEDRLNRILLEAVTGRVRANVVIAAAMGGGKTTLCQALLAHLPDDERVDTIEDTPELRLAEYGIHRSAYERLTRDPNADGVGKHSMADHIRDAKRANSSKLVVGEVRGEGTLALLDAMSSGMSGCLATLHSQPGAGVLEKLVAYACSEGAEPDYARRQIASGVHLLVWLGRNDLGERVIADVTELTGIDWETGQIETRCLWQLRPGDLWAKPASIPNGRIGRLYRSAGVDVPDARTLPSTAPRIVDNRLEPVGAEERT